MARGRMTNVTIALDPEFNAMSIEAQFLFLRTLPHLDRDGLIIGQATALWATVAPLMPQLLAVMPKAIGEWTAGGFVQIIDTKIGPVLYFKKFHNNQSGMRYDREPASRIPLPEGIEATPHGLIFHADNPPSSRRQSDGNPPSSRRPEVEVEVEVEVEQTAAVHTDTVRPHEEPPKAAAAKPDMLWTVWQENMPGTLTPSLVDQINDLRNDYNEQEIVRAIGIAVTRERRNLGYVRGVLEKGIDSAKPPPKEAGPADAALATRAKIERDAQRTNEYLARLAPPRGTVSSNGH